MNDAQTVLDRRLDELANTMMRRLDENSATTNRAQVGVDSLAHLLNQHVLSQAAAAVATGAEPQPSTEIVMHPQQGHDVGTEQGPVPEPPPPSHPVYVPQQIFFFNGVRPQITGRRRGMQEIEAPPPDASLATRSPRRGVAPTWQYPLRVQDMYTVHEPSEGGLPSLQPDHLTIARAAMISPETTALALGAAGPSPLLLPSTDSEHAPSTDMVMFHPGTDIRRGRGSSPGKTRRLDGPSPFLALQAPDSEGPPPVLALPPPEQNPEG